MLYILARQVDIRMPADITEWACKHAFICTWFSYFWIFANFYEIQCQFLVENFRLLLDHISRKAFH